MKIYRAYKKIFTSDGKYYPEIAKHKGARVGLDESEQGDVEAFVQDRLKARVLQGVRDRCDRGDAEKSKAYKRNGAGAEIAFAKLFGGIVKMGLRKTNWAPDAGDVKLWGGYYVDVKHNGLKGHWAAKTLLIPLETLAKSQCDLFALMTGDYPDFQFWGFCPRLEVMERSYKKDQTIKRPGYPVNYHVRESDLLDFWEITWGSLRRGANANLSALWQ